MIGLKDDHLKRIPSAYFPDQEILDLIQKVKEDYEIGYKNLHSSYQEFNNLSVVEVMNRDQKIFNEYVEEPSPDPTESWKANTIRPMSRNKVISIAAHIVARILYPNVFAQNDRDEEDKMASMIMKDLLEWVINDDKTDYKVSFLYGVIGALVNPVSYIKTEYVEAMQTIKKKTDEGVKLIDVMDDLLSGIHVNIVPADEVFIHNPYEYNIQRQKFIIRRRFISYDEAEGLYGRHSDWKYVEPGVRVLFSDDDGSFYEQHDDDNPELVEEVTYYNRREDLQLTFVNGILVSEIDQRIKHRTNKDYPKYEFVKFGYEPIDEKKFFYYKSLVSKLWHQQRLIDRMWNLVMDGSFMSIMPPLNIFGEGEVGTGVMVPGAANYFGGDVKAEPMQTGNQLGVGLAAIQAIDNVAAESSQDKIRSGISGGPQRTAREVLIAEQNAAIQLGLYGVMVATAVRELGELLVDLILQHYTVGDIEEITAGDIRMKFRTFLLPDKEMKGRKVTKRIVFTDEFSGRSLTDKELLKESFKLFNAGGKLDPDTAIYKVNPRLFAHLDFLVRVDADQVGPKNEELDRAFKRDAYDAMIQNPYVDPVQVTRDFLVEPVADGDTEKYMKKAQDIGIVPQAGGPQSNIGNQITAPANSLSALTQA